MDSKYWLRLESGRCNSILTEAYYTVKKEKHEWIENIQHLLFTNGCGNIWYCVLHSSNINQFICRTSVAFKDYGI